MRAILPSVIFAVFDALVFKCCRQQVYKLMFCTFIPIIMRLFPSPFAFVLFVMSPAAMLAVGLPSTVVWLGEKEF